MGVCLTITFFLTIFVMYRIDQSHPPGNARPAASARVTAAEAAKQTSPIRPIYRYSIVAGGVRSADEVVQAMRRDPVVADHYVSVRTADLREEHVQEPMLVHASYRIGDKVFWTKRLLRLQPGEKILTDGTTTIRERCGNLLTTEPLAPELPALIDEPLAPEFEVAVSPWTPGAGYTLDSPPALAGSAVTAGADGTPVGGIGPYFYYVPPGGTPPGGSDTPKDPKDPRDPRDLPPDPPDTPKDPPVDPPKDTPTPTPTPFDITSDPPTPVPEPGTWILLASGLVFVIARAMASRRAL